MLSAQQAAHSGALVGFQWGKTLGKFYSFYIRKTIKLLKIEVNFVSQIMMNASSTPICFDIKFDEDWVWKLIRRLSFLCRLPDIKTARINPCIQALLLHHNFFSRRWVSTRKFIQTYFFFHKNLEITETVDFPPKVVRNRFLVVGEVSHPPPVFCLFEFDFVCFSPLFILVSLS